MRTGLIPAHAGSTEGAGASAAWHTAHPRSRGEHKEEGDMLTKKFGSSPLTRGAPVGELIPRRYVGLIPAHAGSTATSAMRINRWTAHPRSRGEHDSGTSVRGERAGSSPLTRGAPVYHSTGDPQPRLIPAHAGSTAGR